MNALHPTIIMIGCIAGGSVYEFAWPMEALATLSSKLLRT